MPHNGLISGRLPAPSLVKKVFTPAINQLQLLAVKEHHSYGDKSLDSQRTRDEHKVRRLKLAYFLREVARIIVFCTT
jgi:hypothetical protein